MAQAPQHPGNQQQGLGAPQGASQGNPYYQPNQALQAAQAQQVDAQTAKINAERNVLEQQAQAQGLGNVVEGGAPVPPQQVQAEQVADGIIRGQVGQEQLQGMVQSGEIDPAVAEAAMGMAQQFLQADQARQQGLGGI